MRPQRISLLVVVVATLAASCGGSGRAAVSTLVAERSLPSGPPVPTVAGSAPATPPFLGPEQSSGFVLVDPKYRLVQLGIAAESSTSSPAPPAIALYERQDFATIKIGGDAPREALGKLLEVKPPATLGPQASSVLMRYEKGTQVVVVSGAATADEAASLAASTAASLSGADQNALTVPPGFAKMIPKLGGSGVEYQLTYMSGNTMVVLRFAKRPNSDPVELAQPAPEAWIQTVNGRRVQVNAITGNSTIGLSWIEDGFLVSLVSANDLRDSLTLMGSVSPTDAPTWSQLLSDFTKQQLALPTLSSSKLFDQTLELHSDGAYSSSVCRLNAAESICLSALVSNPSLVEFFDKATWEIVGVLSIPGAQVVCRQADRQPTVR